jgi:SAM-dependent methyltransferase
MKTQSIKHTPLTRFLTRQRFHAVLPYLHGDILDLGCGDAGIVDYLPEGTTYTGVDSHPLVIKWLGEQRPGIACFCADVGSPEFRLEQRFDTVLMMALLEHLPAPGQAFSNTANHLRSAGNLVITTPTAAGLSIHSILARFGLVSRYAAAEHHRAFHQNELLALARDAGLEVVEYRRFLFGANQLLVCVLR